MIFLMWYYIMMCGFIWKRLFVFQLSDLIIFINFISYWMWSNVHTDTLSAKSESKPLKSVQSPEPQLHDNRSNLAIKEHLCTTNLCATNGHCLRVNFKKHNCCLFPKLWYAWSCNATNSPTYMYCNFLVWTMTLQLVVLSGTNSSTRQSGQI